MTPAGESPASALERFRRPLLTAAGVLGILALWGVTSFAWPNSAPIGVILQGVVFGTVTGLMAVGLVLIYKTSNIINFAYGGMGGVAGVLAVTLFLEADVNYFLAMALGLATGLAVGGLVEVLVIRRFASSSRLILTVATIGLAQILGGIELFIPRAFGAHGLVGGFQTPLTFSFSIEPVVFTGDHLAIIAVVPPIIGALLWFLLRTDIGIAVRAAADNGERALLLGIPIRRLSTIVWIVAGGLAGLTFILKAPFAGSVSTALGGVATLLLPALAASMVARMESLPIAFAAGVGLGVLEQLVFWNTGRASTIDVAFFAVILIALLVQRGKMSRAFAAGGTWSMSGLVRAIPEELRHLPEVRIARALVLLAIVAAAIVVPLWIGPGTTNLLSTAIVWGMVGVSLVILTGWGGNISLGQFALVGAGAVAFGNIAVRWNVDMFVMLLVAAAAGGLIALLIGLPALRIQGLFLAATTLAFAVALDSFFLNPVNFPDHVPGGLNRPVLWERFDLATEQSMYYVCLGFLGLSILIARSVRGTRSGRVLLATRDNPRSAGAAGVPTTASKLSGFVLSGVVAGLAGGLYIMLLRGVRAGSFLPTMSLEVFSTAVIGGLGSIFGALLGVFSFRLLRQVLTGELRLLVTGAGLLLVLLILPGGIGQAVVSVRDRLLRWVANRRGIVVPSLVADRRDAATEDRPEDETGLLSGALAEDETRDTLEAGR